MQTTPLPETNIVTDADGPDGFCRYCQAEVGDHHGLMYRPLLPDEPCYLPRQRVRVRATIEYEVDIAASDEDGSSFLFHRNEGTYCADNLPDELAAYIERVPCGLDDATFELA